MEKAKVLRTSPAKHDLRGFLSEKSVQLGPRQVPMDYTMIEKLVRDLEARVQRLESLLAKKEGARTNAIAGETPRRGLK